MADVPPYRLSMRTKVFVRALVYEDGTVVSRRHPYKRIVYAAAGLGSLAPPRARVVLVVFKRRARGGDYRFVNLTMLDQRRRGRKSEDYAVVHPVVEHIDVFLAKACMRFANDGR